MSMNVRSMATEYEVSLLPEDHELYFSLALKVRYRGNGRWAVYNGVSVLSKAGDKDLECRDDRDDPIWMEQHRFSLEEALAFAVRMAPFMTVNGRAATEFAKV